MVEDLYFFLDYGYSFSKIVMLIHLLFKLFQPEICQLGGCDNTAEGPYKRACRCQQSNNNIIADFPQPPHSIFG